MPSGKVWPTSRPALADGICDAVLHFTHMLPVKDFAIFRNHRQSEVRSPSPSPVCRTAANCPHCKTMHRHDRCR
eukprot:2945354-Amphidinium_carterae.1